MKPGSREPKLIEIGADAYLLVQVVLKTNVKTLFVAGIARLLTKSRTINRLQCLIVVAVGENNIRVGAKFKFRACEKPVAAIIGVGKFPKSNCGANQYPLICRVPGKIRS